MEEQFKKLKDLALARKIAVEYDYVPYQEDAEDVHNLLTEGLNETVELEKVSDILREYGGNSYGRIENMAFDLIDEMEWKQ